MNRFWEVEHDTTSKPFSLEEKACVESFLRDVKRNLEGRFIVKLPTRQDKLDELGESKDIALNVSNRWRSKFIAQSHMYDEYSKFMDEYKLSLSRRRSRHCYRTGNSSSENRHPMLLPSRIKIPASQENSPYPQTRIPRRRR